MKRTQRDLIVLTASIGIGIGVGVGMGMLLSPRSGREARDLLQTTANQLTVVATTGSACVREAAVRKS